MALYSVSDRECTLEAIASLARRNEHIVALIVVGSGAVGYIDELSDLDFVVAVDDDAHLESVMAYISERLRQRLRMIYVKQNDSRRLQVYLTERYLEIDIGYGAYARAAAFRKDWKVLFDKSGTVDAAMRRSWEQIARTPDTGKRARVYAECADAIWHSFMHCAVAIKREQYWRAAAELERARELWIGLLGCRYALDVERGRELDRLPEAERARLLGTLIAKPAADELWRGLDALIDAVYDELERYGGPGCLQVGRAQVREYADACRSLG